MVLCYNQKNPKTVTWQRMKVTSWEKDENNLESDSSENSRLNLTSRDNRFPWNRDSCRWLVDFQCCGDSNLNGTLGAYRVHPPVR
eukprot:scaffold69613_cov58-Attheya_sp.AAC.1